MRFKSVFLVIIFAVSFSGLWAVWEGNGGVGASSDFAEKGLFVRSDVFPKHTLVEITNLEKNITAKAIVIAPSGVQGLLLSLSPELAEVLQIPRGKVARIRVSTPSPVKEIGDDGIDIIGKIEPELPAEPVEPKAEYKIEEPEAKIEEPILIPAETEPIPTEPVIEEPAVPPAPVPPAPPVKTVYLEPSDLRPPKIVPPIKNREDKTEEKNTAPVKDIQTPVEPKDDTDEKPAPVENISQPEPPEPETEKENIEEVKEVNQVEPPKEDLKEDSKEVYTIPPISDKLQGEEKNDSGETEIVSEEVPEVYSVTENTEIENLPEEKKESAKESITDKNIEETPAEDIKKYTDKLQKGKYYVQIAAYHDELNVKNVILKYGKTYPIVVEENNSSSGVKYFIFVGPLQEDEIGAAKERFKSFGFKECFLKKGK